MTPEEKHLWYDVLKSLPYTVKRQHNIDNYIVDFYIPQKKIVIEIDGTQHNSLEHKEADIKRDNVHKQKLHLRSRRYTKEDGLKFFQI